jgi:hypothetical protein
MSGQLTHPRLADDDMIFLLIIITRLVSLLIGSPNHFLKPVPFQGSYQAKEKFPLRKLV